MSNKYDFPTVKIEDGIIKKVSTEWEKECDYRVLDPDGWDRKNFEFSWFKELITEDEFFYRLVRSTVMYKKGETDKELYVWAK